MFATWRCRNFRAWCPAGRSCSSSDRVNSPKDFFLEGSNDDDLGTVTAQQQRQQQQQQAIDLIRLRNSVWITALVTAERRQQRLIQACKIRDLYHSIQQTSPRCSIDNSLNRSALAEIEAIDSIHVHHWILFLLEKSEQSSSILLLFLIGESIAHPPVGGPLSEHKINKTHTTPKILILPRNQKTNQKPKQKESSVYWTSSHTRQKQIIWSQKLSWTARTAIIGNPLLWRWSRLFCFVFSKFIFSS